jgi:glycolate oxidase FAD binding subunit
VTGYDLCKLIAGSWGTLAVMTDVTLKVMPKAESETTLVLRGLDDITANRVMTAALGSPFDLSGAAHVPPSTLRSAGFALAALDPGQQGITLLRLEGIKASVAHRARSLAQTLAPFGNADAVDDAVSVLAWSSVRDVAPFAASGALGTWPVWRIVCPPAVGGVFGQALVRESGGEVMYDWGGGLIWAALPPSADAHAISVREQAKAVGGHASLIRAADAVRSAVDVFHPPEAGLAALSRRVKRSFDPKSILNRGRMLRESDEGLRTSEAGHQSA